MLRKRSWMHAHGFSLHTFKTAANTQERAGVHDDSWPISLASGAATAASKNYSAANCGCSQSSVTAAEWVATTPHFRDCGKVISPRLRQSSSQTYAFLLISMVLVLAAPFLLYRPFLHLGRHVSTSFLHLSSPFSLPPPESTPPLLPLQGC